MEDVASPSKVISPALAESQETPQPSSSARLRFRLRPAEIEGAAEGVVPPGEAHTLITTFGMIAMGVVGITGATITMRIASPHALAWFFVVAMAELGLAAAVIGLTARRDLFPVRARSPRRRLRAGR